MGYCKFCGKPLKGDGTCKACDSAKKKESKKADTQIPKEGKKSKVWIPIVIGAVVLAAAAVVTIVLLSGGDNEKKKDENKADSGTSDSATSDTTPVDLSKPFKVEAPDTEQILKDSGEVRGKIAVTDSTRVQSESELYDDFYGRGFRNMDIQAVYDMEGTYTSTYSISNYASDRHPMYTAYYSASSGELWALTSINGVLMAEPMFTNFNEANNGNKPIIITETDSVFSYDPANNCFFDYVPGEDYRIVKVAKINSQTLDSLTTDQLGG